MKLGQYFTLIFQAGSVMGRRTTYRRKKKLVTLETQESVVVLSESDTEDIQHASASRISPSQLLQNRASQRPKKKLL